MRRIPLLLLLFAMLLTVPVWAETDGEAANISAECRVTANGQPLSLQRAQGGSFYLRSPAAGTVLSISSADAVGGLYLRFNQLSPKAPPRPWTLEAGGVSYEFGAEGYLHQFAGGFSATELTLTFPEAMPPVTLCVLSEGATPDWVQVWQPPLERADVLLLPTHSDDDQLYFAGMAPWCLSQGASVQVAYLVEHYGDGQRTSELLDGLWTCGLRNYPVLGRFRDMGRMSYSTTMVYYDSQDIKWEDFEGYQVELLRRFRPQVAVTHALDGEYGHGTHILNCRSMLSAVQLSADATAYPDSAERWGLWDTPKLYVHSYEKDQIILDLDSPLPAYDGATAFQMAQRSFRCHTSQQDWFGWWIYGPDTAAEIVSYNPRIFGLYRSTVGPDVGGDSLFDNVILYAEQERQAALAAQLAAEEEAARVAAEEEAARLAAQEAEQAAREEAARLMAEAQAQAEAEAAAAEYARRQRLLGWLLAAVSLVIVGALAAAVVIHRREKRERRG